MEHYTAHSTEQHASYMQTYTCTLQHHKYMYIHVYNIIYHTVLLCQRTYLPMTLLSSRSTSVVIKPLIQMASGPIATLSCREKGHKSVAFSSVPIPPPIHSTHLGKTKCLYQIEWCVDLTDIHYQTSTHVYPSYLYGHRESLSLYTVLDGNTHTLHWFIRVAIVHRNNEIWN